MLLVQIMCVITLECITWWEHNGYYFPNICDTTTDICVTKHPYIYWPILVWRTTIIIYIYSLARPHPYPSKGRVWLVSRANPFASEGLLQRWPTRLGVATSDYI